MQQLSNFGTTTLSATLTSGATSASLTDGSVFPATGDYVLLVESEYIFVTARSSNTVTITRAYGGTSDVTHASGSTVKLVLSKEVLENYFGERIQCGGYASRPATARAGWLYYATDLNYAWYYDGGNWNLYDPLYVPYANRVDLSGWTAVNQGTSTWTDTNGILTVGMPSNSGDNIRLYHKALPSAPYKINCILQSANVNAQYSGAGIGLYNSSNGKIHSLLNFNNGNTGSIQSFSVDTYSSITAFQANQIRQQGWGSPFWFQIEDDNTNWSWRSSFDGVKYNLLYQETRNTYVTPDKVCILADRTETAINDMHYYQFLAYWEQ